MANPDHLAKLKEALEAEDIEIWNKWRKENPKIKPDLREADLSGAHLERANLEGANLEGAVLGGANLSEADLRWANLRDSWLRGVNLNGVDLYMAHLERADLVRSHFRKASLWKAHLEEADLRNSHLEKADLRAAHLEGACLREAHLENADLTDANLEGSDLCGANLKGTVLIGANLERAQLTFLPETGAMIQGTKLEGANLFKANLEGANLRGALLAGANLGGAHLEGAELRRADFKDVNVTGANIDRNTKFLGSKNKDSCYGSPKFIRMAKDNEYLEELRLTKKGEWIYRIWWLVADCGRSFSRWFVVCLVLALFFGGIFCWMGEPAFEIKHLDYGNFFSYFYYSVVTFTTLGFGDVVPKTWQAAAWVMLEVFIGYVMLGGLISILANKLARRGD